MAAKYRHTDAIPAKATSSSMYTRQGHLPAHRTESKAPTYSQPSPS